MLIPRLLAALVLIPLVVIVLFFLPLNIFAAVIILVCGLAAWEWAQFLNIRQTNSRLIFAIIWVGALCAMYYGLSPIAFSKACQFALILSLVWWCIALVLVIAYPGSAKSWQKSTVTKVLFSIATLWPFFVGMIVLRMNAYEYNPYVGATSLLYVLVLAWAADSGAYFAGLLFGKHKLAPKVSPGKTWEGFIGGLITALIIAVLASIYLFNTVPFTKVMIGSFVAILVSVLGDLTESMFKREAGIKDSGHLIPGHGGVLDRIDSLTAAVPVFAALVFLIL